MSATKSTADWLGAIVLIIVVFFLIGWLPNGTFQDAIRRFSTVVAGSDNKEGSTSDGSNSSDYNPPTR